MAEETTPGRTFLEGEAYALVDQAVARETAADKAKIEELETANADLGTKVDTLETEKAQAISAKEAAEQALAAKEAEYAEREAAQARKGTRLAEVAAANPHLDLTDEKRIERIVAMKDEDYTAYLEDMRVVGQAAGGTPNPGGPPRESAALTPTPPPGDDKKASVSGLFSASRATREGS
jgi:hypothetical protein